MSIAIPRFVCLSVSFLLLTSSAMAQHDPAGITGGVAQALIATAIGIVIALVALFAFNFFSRRIDTLMDELESFANGWLADLRIERDGTAS